MHYCFFSVGSWERNGTLLRLRDLGPALIRRGVRVSYVLDDTPWNRAMELHPDAHRAFVLLVLLQVARVVCAEGLIHAYLILVVFDLCSMFSPTEFLVVQLYVFLVLYRE